MREMPLIRFSGGRNLAAPNLRSGLQPERDLHSTSADSSASPQPSQRFLASVGRGPTECFWWGQILELTRIELSQAVSLRLIAHQHTCVMASDRSLMLRGPSTTSRDISKLSTASPWQISEVYGFEDLDYPAYPARFVQSCLVARLSLFTSNNHGERRRPRS